MHVDSEVDILVVGAGLAGAATVFHLAKRTHARIMVLEQEAMLGMHSSGRNAAIVREHGVDPALRPLVAEGATWLRDGELARFERRGVMLLGLGDENVQPYFPYARGSGLWCPDDGTVDVAGLLSRYLVGSDVRYETRVTRWVQRGEEVHVETNRGGITCGLLINASGPWAGELGGLPLTPLNRHVFCTPPLDWVNPEWPCVWDTVIGLYFRPESGGLLLSCCDELAAEPGDYRESPAVLEQIAAKLASAQPELRSLSISSTWVGQRVFASDRRFVIGYDPRDDRVFHVAGLGGHGVTASYAIGRIAADLIVDGVAEGSGAFAPQRLFQHDTEKRYDKRP